MIPHQQVSDFAVRTPVLSTSLTNIVRPSRGGSSIKIAARFSTIAYAVPLCSSGHAQSKRLEEWILPAVPLPPLQVSQCHPRWGVSIDATLVYVSLESDKLNIYHPLGNED